MKLEIKTALRRFQWEGNRSIQIRQKIIGGPTNLLDRHVSLDLSFENIKELISCMHSADKALYESALRTDAINSRNQGE